MTQPLPYASPDTRQAPRYAPARGRAIGLAITALTLVGMLAFTWRTWPDPIVDFGRELYVPWQLAQGKVLYRDIAHFNGPFSQYFNSLVFRVAGPSLMALAWTNILILCAMLLMLHRLLASIADEFAATVACIAVTILLATGQPGPAATYNFVTPYAHELTHGIVLSIAMLACVRRFEMTRRIGWMIGAGLLMGLVVLTKPEVTLAAGACAIIAVLATPAPNSRRRWIVACVFGGAAVIPVLVALMLLSCGMPIRDAARGIFGAWRWVIDPRLSSMRFYRIVRGTDDLGASIIHLFLATLCWIALLACPAFLAPRVKISRPAAFGVALLVSAIVLGAGWRLINWQDVARPLILATPLIAIWCWRTRRWFELSFAIFATLLLAKIALNVQLYHYGFALALPALALVIVVSSCWLPAWLNGRAGNGALVRGAVTGALLVLCARYVTFMHQRYQLKATTVGAGADAFQADDRGRSVKPMVRAVEQLPPGETVAAMPQGLMVNFLARRVNPSRYLVLMPPEVTMFGVDRIVQDLHRAPPDDVLLIDTDYTEYGVGDFATGYGKPIYDWLRAEYQPVLRSDDPALKWMLLRRTMR